MENEIISKHGAKARTYNLFTTPGGNGQLKDG